MSICLNFTNSLKLDANERFRSHEDKLFLGFFLEVGDHMLRSLFSWIIPYLTDYAAHPHFHTSFCKHFVWERYLPIQISGISFSQ